jgi:transcriptional regulator with XRE-family HTH domain
MNPGQIRHLRKTLALTQQQFAELLGVSFVTLNRWENGQSKPSAMGQAKLQALAGRSGGHLAEAGEPSGRSSASDKRDATPRLDFLVDANALRVLVEGERLSYGHLLSAPAATSSW